MISVELQLQLASHDVIACDEVALRMALESQCETYTLIKLAPWAARRWKCHYRLLMGDTWYDAQSVEEAYARTLVALLARV